MVSRSKLVSGALALGVSACAAAAAWWWLDVDRSAFYTDGDALRAPIREHAPRDVLWQEPDPVRTADRKPITAIDVYVCPDESLMLLTRRTARGDTDLYRADRTDAGWSDPEPIAELNSLDNELAPSLSPDGRRLCFATDRPGGRGGLDIWVSEHTETGWSTPTPTEWNSARDDTDPHVALDPTDGTFVVLFSSDRPELASSEPVPGFSIFAAREGEEAFRLRRPTPGYTLADPALTPSADFFYWVSSSLDGTDISALYRQRARLDPEQQMPAEQLADPPEPMDRSIVGLPGISSPSLSLEGFSLHLLTGSDDDPQLVRAIAREVYLSRTSTRGDLLGIIPWILLALATVMLLSLLRRGASSVRWRTTLGTLGLMARCALASLVIHTALMALLTVLHVAEEEGQPSASSTGRVALSSSSVRSALAGQLRKLEPSASVAESLQSSPQARVSLPSRPAAARLKPAPLSTPPTVTSTAASADEAAPTPASTAAPVVASGPQITMTSPTVSGFRLPAPSRTSESATPEAAMPGLSRSVSELAPQSIDVGAFDSTASPGPAVTQAATSTRIDLSPRTNAMEASAYGTAAISEPVQLLPSEAPGISISTPNIGQPVASTVPDDQDFIADDQPLDAYLARSRARQETDGSLADSAPTHLAPAPISFSAAILPATRDTPAAPADAVSPTIPFPEIALDVPTAAPALDGISLPEAIALSFDIVGLVVDDETGAPIQGASVRLDLAAENDAVATTKHDGSFGLSFEQMPDNAAVTATMPGYAPGAVNISATQIDTGERVTIRLSPDDPFLIALEQDPTVHHLGDDAFTGRINSQFQRESEGLSLRFSFTLTDEHAKLPVRGVEFRVLAKGTQLNNPVIVNGTRIGVFDDSPSDGSFGEQHFSIPAETLRFGENTVTLRSVESPGTDHDDYEFVNPRIVFLPITDGPI